MVAIRSKNRRLSLVITSRFLPLLTFASIVLASVVVSTLFFFDFFFPFLYFGILGDDSSSLTRQKIVANRQRSRRAGDCNSLKPRHQQPKSWQPIDPTTERRSINWHDKSPVCFPIDQFDISAAFRNSNESNELNKWPQLLIITTFSQAFSSLAQTTQTNHFRQCCQCFGQRSRCPIAH